MGNLSKNFSVDEFYIGVEDYYQTLKAGNIDPRWYISPLLVEGLQVLRNRILSPVLITSAFRTPAHNALLKRQGYKASKYSLHLFGAAADIYCPEVAISDLYDCVKGVELFKGIGVSKNFIHVDVRNSKEVVKWKY